MAEPQGAAGVAASAHDRADAAISTTMVVWATLPTPLGTLHLYGGTAGLLSIVLPNEARLAAEAWLRRRLGPVCMIEDAGALAEPLAQLADYFAGRRRSFDLRLDPRGTSFQRRVWAAVATIPFGETRSYGEIARAIDQPAAVRAVGQANGVNPLPLVIPCHRVIGASGALTGYGGGLAAKRALLAFERGQSAFEESGFGIQGPHGPLITGPLDS